MTLSITGRCARTGDLGSAITSYDFRWTFLPSYQDSFDLGGLSVVVGGVGAVTAQAMSPPTLAAPVLDSLKRGLNAREALEATLAQQAGEAKELCQVAVVDAAGGSAGFTGEHPQEWRGHATGEGWVAAGNILASGRVVDALGEAFETNSHRPLDERLLIALEAGVAAGGDRRGHRGALLRLATGRYISNLEIRVHEHANPIAELRRLLDAFHSETDIEKVAMRAFDSGRSYMGESRIREFADLTTQQAVEGLRGVLLEEGAPGEAVRALDDLLAVLANKPDMQQVRFGDALVILARLRGT